MPIVEPHRYADTPIFRTMLYEREGRFPGTPEGEEPIETPEYLDEPQKVVEPTTVTPSGQAPSSLVPIRTLAALVPVMPVQPDGKKS
jgi:hypothetical protein